MQTFEVNCSAPKWATDVEVGIRLDGAGRARADEISLVPSGRAHIEAVEQGSFQVQVVDGRELPGLPYAQERVIKGDAKCHAIAAASILAKTARDRMMRKFDERYPGYGFTQHKGYPTVSHRVAIAELGPCPIHRRSFTLLPR